MVEKMVILFVKQMWVLLLKMLKKVLPEVVGTRPNGVKAVKYDRLCALLIECVKDLQNQIDDLKDK